MNSARARWTAFLAQSEPVRDSAIFAGVFFGIWAVYDALDLTYRGTASTYWLQAGAQPSILALLQGVLVLCEVAIVALAARDGVGRMPMRALIGAALVLRAIEAGAFFPLNDFFYYCTTSFVIVNIARTGEATVAAWPRTVLLYETAWMYFATMLLKCNPHWLSGEHLWVRLGYFQTTFGWHVPWSALLQNLPVDRALAVAGSTMEATMAFALLLRAQRAWLIALAIAIHGFAALSVNVYFFGLAMIVQVWYVSSALRNSPRSSSTMRQR